VAYYCPGRTPMPYSPLHSFLTFFLSSFTPPPPPHPPQAQLLETHFFPRWLAVLRHWVGSPAPDYDEVTRWYLGWKGLIPDEVLDTERIRAQMAAALDLMNSAVEGRGVPPVWTPAPDVAAAATAQAAAATAQAGPPRPAGAAAFDATRLSLRELVEEFAAEAGVEFLPRVPPRDHDGLQVYQFGWVSCVVDASAGLVKVQSGGAWTPVSLEGLLVEHQRRARERAKKKA
jgi:tuftelin-interacting protein 11